jgi:hypothetical protein
MDYRRFGRAHRRLSDAGFEAMSPAPVFTGSIPQIRPPRLQRASAGGPGPCTST